MARGALLLALAFGGISPATAQSERPRIVLVLSGGGARGAAHVGVLRVLEEAQVPIDAIVGTSMGAIVGGLYAAGMSPDELEAALVDTDWDSFFTNRPPRNERYFRRKEEDQEYLVRYSIHLKNGKPQLPLGLIQAQKLENRLKYYEISTTRAADFDRLRIPFRAVAADLADGRAVVLDHGSLATAMRASMSIPGVFPPVVIEGRQLVDGGVAQNLPVEIARELGADVLIAIDISTPIDPDIEPSSALGVIGRLSDFLTAKNVGDSKQKLGPDDILVEPPLGDIGVQGFARAKEAIEIGEREARAVLGRLRALGVSDSEWARFLARQRRRPIDPPVIAAVRLENQSAVNDRIIRAQIEGWIGKPLDIERLSDDLSRLYGLGIFEPISFDVKPSPEGAVLELQVRSRATGLSEVRFGLGFEDDFEGGDAYELALRVNRFAVNRQGGEWRADLSLGESSGIRGEFYQPLDPALRWYVSAEASYERENLYLTDEGRKLAQVLVEEPRLGISVGRNLGRWGRARLDVERGRLEGDVLVPEDVLVQADEEYAGWAVGLQVDTLDSISFPTSGGIAEAFFTQRREFLGGRTESEDISVRATWARTFGRTTFLPGVEARFDQGGVDDDSRDALLGGVFRLSGLEPNELIGPEAILGRVVVYHELSRRQFRVLQPGWYVGGSIEAGNVFQHGESMDLDDLIVAGSVFIGADTPLGPMQLGWGWAEDNRKRVYLAIGRNFL